MTETRHKFTRTYAFQDEVIYAADAGDADGAVTTLIGILEARPMLDSTPKLPRLADIPPGTTKYDLGKQLYPDLTFDTALPQPWVDMMVTGYYFDPRLCVVWGYPPGNAFGNPYPLTQEAKAHLSRIYPEAT